MHELCVFSHWCQKMRKSNLEPVYDYQNMQNWRFISLSPLNSFINYNYQPSSNIDLNCFNEKTKLLSNLKYSLSSSYHAINSLLKMANWLSSRRKSKELINKANLKDKHVNQKFGLLKNEKLAQKKLKQLFKKDFKKSSSKIFNYSTIKASSKHLFSPSFDKSSNVTNDQIDQEIDSSKQKEILTYCPLSKAQTLKIESKKVVDERLCATWPPQSSFNVCPITDPVFTKQQYEKYFNQFKLQSERDFNVEEVIKEWTIPFQDLQFKEILKEGEFGYVHHGHWHGDVLIYTFRNGNSKESVRKFWESIVQLCMVRHENISLFMGACVDSPNLAVVTSMRKGPSLYEYIHIKQQTIYLPNKIHIARQIAQAMGYLHAKGITHKRLTSDNIFLESKVKICLIDQGSLTYSYTGTKYGVNSRGHLTYLSPELIRSVQVNPPYLFNSQKFSQEIDVYAFGTILFELMVGKFPFENISSHTIIWLVGTGCTENILLIKGSPVIRSIVEACWSRHLLQRPPFSQIVKRLQENVSLNKTHSSSEPERLNKIGFI